MFESFHFTTDKTTSGPAAVVAPSLRSIAQKTCHVRSICLHHALSVAESVESGELQGGCLSSTNWWGKLIRSEKQFESFTKGSIWWGSKHLPKKTQGLNNFSNTWSLLFNCCWRTSKRIYFKPVSISGNQCVFDLRKSVASLSHEKEFLPSGSLASWFIQYHSAY